MELLPYQQRVLEEKEQLDVSIRKLDKFINSDEFTSSVVSDEQARLKLQLFLMKQYSDVLNERLKAFVS